MGRRKDPVLIGVSLMVVLGVSVGLASLRFLPASDLKGVIEYGGFALSVVSALIGGLRWLWGSRRPADPRPVNTLANMLAQAVHVQWRTTATERVLVTPAPIPVGWSLSDLPVTGTVETAVGDPDVAPAFSPLPGQTRVTEEQLRVGGGRGGLFDVYAGIASGRVVVIGTPGAGKTGTAILLLLDALEHRDRVDDKDRARVPVPVLLTAHGWDPTTRSVQDWLADRLAATYPLFQHRGGQAEAAALVAAGAVALILDGLDEMDIARRPAALQALSDAPFRVVVLTRSQEMVEAAGTAWLVGAVALQLHDVTGPQAADYLHRARTGPAPGGWTQLLTHLRENPDSVLTRGLSIPLTLTLVRDTYRPDDDVSELLTGTRSGTADDLEQRLIARVLPDAYTPRPGRPEPRYSLPQAKQALTFLARQMNHTRDLAWWHVPRWAPITPRILASTMAGGLLGMLASALASVVGAAALALLGGQGFWTSLRDEPVLELTFGLGVGLALGFCFGRGGREPRRVKDWRAISVRSVLAAGFAYGLVSVIAVVLMGLAVLFVSLLVFEVANWLLANRVNVDMIPVTILEVMGLLMIGLVVGLTFGSNGDLLGGHSERRDSSQRSVKSRHYARKIGIVGGVVAGIVYGTLVGIESVRPPDPVPLVFGIVGGLVFGIVGGLVVWTVVWIVWLGGGLMGGLVPRLARRFVAGLAVRSAKGEGSPQTPLESWRNDRAFGLVAGIAFGLSFGLVIGLLLGLASGLGNDVGYGLHPGLVAGLAVGLAAWLDFGLALGLVCGIVYSQTWSTTLSWLQLQRSRRVPTVDLVPFLEDARDRGVLRTVGPIYQFRHATLQDQLAGQTTASPATSPAAQLLS